MEIALANFFNPRQNLIVPNVWWGLDLNHECDLLVVSKSGFATEIEIKTSIQDLKKDLKKSHGHVSKKIRKLFFAMPEEMIKPDFVPIRAGIISIYRQNSQNLCRIIKPPHINKTARSLTDKEILHLGSLAAMRIWTLKTTLSNKRSNSWIPK